MLQTTGFSLFGSAHLLSLALIAGCCLGISRVAERDAWQPLRTVIAALLIIHAAVKPYLFVVVGELPWQLSLPLDLCRINEILCAYLLMRRSFRIFEVSYFWAMGGSISALLTPDLGHGFPHPLFLSFFLGHGLALVAVLYAIFGYGFRPRLRSLAIALILTAVYASLIYPLNHLLDSNYLFLRSKPAAGSVLDLFGPWPDYILGLCGLALLACILSYLPFVKPRR